MNRSSPVTADSIGIEVQSAEPQSLSISLLDCRNGVVMDRDLQLVTDWLLCASSQVPPDYFQLAVAGQEDSEYRERVYCYELYHRWRCHWPDGYPYSLAGEIDKSGHPIIRNAAKPDFLVHIPGHMNNLLIVEVKPVQSTWSLMADDLRKLTYYRRNLVPAGHPGNYNAAYFWLYGLRTVEWPAFRKQLLKQLGGDEHFDKTLVSCFLHESPGKQAVRVAWD